MTDRLKGVFSPWLRRRRFALVQQFIKAGQVVDYGCGIGLLANFIPPERYVGLDLDDLSLGKARQEFPTHRFFHLSEFEPDKKFDTLIALAVIQYLPDPEQFLRWALALLSPGGKVVITTPNPAAEPLLLVGGRLGLLGKDSRKEHLTLLDKSGFFALAQRLGIPLTEYSTFLLGLNQLAVYRNPIQHQTAGLHAEGLEHGV
jgi:2-polyprenyl-3-methyl-5-hydroxy-6-metoxy-1,4-benzoquinol methylase